MTSAWREFKDCSIRFASSGWVRRRVISERRSRAACAAERILSVICCSPQSIIAGSDVAFDEEIADRGADWHACHFLYPQILTIRINLQKHISSVWCQNHIDGAVGEPEMAHKRYALLRHLAW